MNTGVLMRVELIRWFAFAVRSLHCTARCIGVLGLVALTAAPSAHAAQPGAGQAMIATRLLPGETIVLDGTLAHPAWQRAAVHADFVEKFPDTGAKPSHATQVQVLFDQQALYIGVRALEASPERIRAPLVRHDGVNRTQDFIVAYIDAIGSRQSAQFFRVNAAGSTADGMHTAADDSEDFAPDFDFDAATTRDAQGWTSVLRIPFASLRFSGQGQPAWRIMVGRRIPREQFLLYTSVLIPREAPSFIATLQPLQGVVLPEANHFISLRPSLTWRQLRDQAPGQAATQRSEFDASLDVKWRPRPEWVIDGTLNPDFSQVALDVPQISGNTRFALSFPEKRPFFFESSDLLRSPTEALYTRSFTEPRWGLRSTWRSERWSGTAFGIDDRGGGFVLLPSAWGTGVAEQPASRSLAARGLWNQGGVQLGALAVSRDYANGRGSNQVLGPDMAWQVNDAWRMRAQLLQSSTTAQQGTDGELHRAAGIDGQRLALRVNYQGHLQDGWMSLDDISPGFRHDSGFVNQNDVRSASVFYATGWQQVGPMNELWLNLRVDHARAKSNGQIVNHDLYPGVWMTGPHNFEWSFSWHGDAQLRTAPGAPLLQQNFWRTELTVTPASWIPFLQASGRIGRVADVQANTVRPGGDFNLKLTTRPLAQLELEPSLAMAWLRRDGLRTYRESAAQVLGVWHFNAQQTLRAIVQRTSIDRLDEPGITGYADRSSVGSLTWAWRRSSGTTLFVGASRGRHGLGLPARSNEVFVKLQADVDDLRRAW